MMHFHFTRDPKKNRFLSSSPQEIEKSKKNTNPKIFEMMNLKSLSLSLLLLQVVCALSDHSVKNQIVDANQYMKKVASVRIFALSNAFYVRMEELHQILRFSCNLVPILCFEPLITFILVRSL